MVTDYRIGVNYWDSKSGTDMWKNFDRTVIEDDLRALSEIGVKALRVFPNWRDFQPVCALHAWRGNFKEYRLTEDRMPENEFFLEPVMLDRFRVFCDIAQSYRLTLIVGIVTGWMSGRLFCPPALEGKNLIRDPEALMLQDKFIRGFVRAMKDHPAIEAWELGNETNCLGVASTAAESYVWVMSVVNAVRAEDQSRPVYSGMHGLSADPAAPWSIAQQGELTDMLTCHPYPSPTVGGDVDPADRLRTTIIPTVQLAYYAGLSGKPAMIEEQGTFSDMLINRQGAADFMRVNLWSGWANGSKGYFWWCGMEHLHLTKPPYTWSMIERELGIVDAEKNPKPVGTEMKRMSALLETLPALPEKETDAVCVLSREQDTWANAVSAYILAKQAGFELELRASSQPIPKGKRLYLLPSVTGWASLYKECYDSLLAEAAENGATLYISVASGLLCEFERVTGLRSDGMEQMPGAHRGTFVFDGETLTLPIEYQKKFLLHPLDAEVLASDETGNPLLSLHSFGKGKIYLLGFPMEDMLWRKPQIYCADNAPAYYRIYREIAAEILSEKPLTAKNPQIGLTLHPCKDGTYYAVCINYSEKEQNACLKIADGWMMTSLYGDAEKIPKCSAAVLRLVHE